MTPLLLANMFDFSFLPRYASYFIRGVEYTLILSAAAVLLAIIPALLLALMPVSYTHLDVYKRQFFVCLTKTIRAISALVCAMKVQGILLR